MLRDKDSNPNLRVPKTRVLPLDHPALVGPRYQVIEVHLFYMLSVRSNPNHRKGPVRLSSRGAVGATCVDITMRVVQAQHPGYTLQALGTKLLRFTVYLTSDLNRLTKWIVSPLCFHQEVTLTFAKSLT